MGLRSSIPYRPTYQLVAGTPATPLSGRQQHAPLPANRPERLDWLVSAPKAQSPD